MNRFASFLKLLRRHPRILIVAGVLLALAAWAAPRPYTNISVSPGVVTLVTLTDGASVILQCPKQASGAGGFVSYRGMTTADMAQFADGGAQVDGGAFGTEADFRNQGDPIGIVMGSGQAGLGFLGLDSGTSPCSLQSP